MLAFVLPLANLTVKNTMRTYIHAYKPTFAANITGNKRFNLEALILTETCQVDNVSSLANLYPIHRRPWPSFSRSNSTSRSALRTLGSTYWLILSTLRNACVIISQTAIETILLLPTKKESRIRLFIGIFTMILTTLKINVKVPNISNVNISQPVKDRG